MKTLEFGKYCVLGLSPMDDITDLPFRQLCKDFGADLLITEFIASEALNREAEKSYRKMRFTPSQHPIGIQIFGADEDELLRCLDIVEQQEPDFIDINWGCPVRKVAGKGAGSGILKDIPKMLRITEALVKRSHLPVTVWPSGCRMWALPPSAFTAAPKPRCIRVRPTGRSSAR